MTHKFELGINAKDIVTGQTGILTSRTEFLNGCVRYGFSPPVDKDNKYVEGYNIDEQQIEYLDRGVTEQLNNSTVSDLQAASKEASEADHIEGAKSRTGGPTGPAPSQRTSTVR